MRCVGEPFPGHQAVHMAGEALQVKFAVPATWDCRNTLKATWEGWRGWTGQGWRFPCEWQPGSASFFLSASLDYFWEHPLSERLVPAVEQWLSTCWPRQQRQAVVVLTFPPQGSTGLQGHAFLVDVHSLRQDNSGKT